MLLWPATCSEVFAPIVTCMAELECLQQFLLLRGWKKMAMLLCSKNPRFQSFEANLLCQEKLLPVEQVNCDAKWNSGPNNPYLTSNNARNNFSRTKSLNVGKKWGQETVTALMRGLWFIASTDSLRLWPHWVRYLAQGVEFITPATACRIPSLINLPNGELLW